jgi:hypothetical protein
MLSDMLWGGSCHNRSMTIGGSTARQPRTSQPETDATPVTQPAAHIARTQRLAIVIFMYSGFMIRLYRRAATRRCSRVHSEPGFLATNRLFFRLKPEATDVYGRSRPIDDARCGGSAASSVQADDHRRAQSTRTLAHCARHDELPRPEFPAASTQRFEATVLMMAPRGNYCAQP